MRDSPDPDELRDTLEALLRKDQVAKWLGVSLIDAEPGMVRLEMTVGPEHVNFIGTCHGGVLFSFADTAFGLASNSRGVMAIAVHADIAFTRAAREGDRIVAVVEELARSRRVGSYRVTVRGAAGEVLSAFTGTVHVTSRPQV